MPQTGDTITGLWTFVTTLSVVLAAQLVTKPSNTAEFVGRRVILLCKVDNGKDISWSKCSAQGNCTRISKGDRVIITDPDNRYSIENPSPGEFNLVVDPLNSKDGLQYECKVSDILTSDVAYSELVVLNGTLKCSHNATLNNLVEGSVIKISCQQLFAGRWAPNIRCGFRKSSFWINMADASSPTTSIYEGLIQISLKFDGDQIFCDAYFLHPKSWEYLSSEEAQNRPHILDTWVSSEITVLHGPVSISLTPDDSVFRVGDSITCTSLANPPASYAWLNDDDDVIATGAAITLDRALAGLWRMRCEASNDFGTMDIARQVYVYENEFCDSVVANNGHPALITGVTLGIALLLSIILNIVLLLYIKRPDILQLTGCSSDKTKTYRSKNTQFAGLSVSSGITENPALNLGHCLDNPSPYNYISEGDLTGSVSSVSEQQSTHYESFSFGNSSGAERGSLPTAPSGRTLGRERDQKLAGNNASLQRFSSDQCVNTLGRGDRVKPTPARSMNALNTLGTEVSHTGVQPRPCYSIATLETYLSDSDKCF